MLMLPVLLAMRMRSEPAVAKIVSPVEEAVRELAELMVRVDALPVVCQVEAATPVRFKDVSEVMLAEPMVIVEPMVVVPT